MVVCSCSHRCPDRATMRARHGTPDEFSVSVGRALGYWVSVGEANQAIRRYRAEYDAAPEQAQEKDPRE